MRVAAIFTTLLSVASALPSLQPRDTRILDLVIQTWPTEAWTYNNQSFAFFTVAPRDDGRYNFGFSNSDPANAGTLNTFTVTGDGLETIVETLGSAKSAERVVDKTGKPFRIVIDSNYP